VCRDGQNAFDVGEFRRSQVIEVHQAVLEFLAIGHVLDGAPSGAFDALRGLTGGQRISRNVQRLFLRNRDFCFVLCIEVDEVFVCAGRNDAPRDWPGHGEAVRRSCLRRNKPLGPT
jgi:hypothetical protein